MPVFLVPYWVKPAFNDRSNVGYINNKLIYLDVGQFSLSTPSSHTIDSETEIQLRVSEIPAWFARKKQ